MAGNDDRFTGGDDFVAGTLGHAAHLAMMSNELNGGRGAYRISNAELGNSGPSYGPFQYDLGANTRARELFEEIATTAADENGDRYISDQDLNTVRDNLYQPFRNIKTNAIAQDAYDRFLPAINTTLASDAGRRLINDDYARGIDAKVDSVNAVIASVSDPTNRAFLERNQLAQLIILDTANQYGPPVNNGMHRFMGMSAESEPMQMPLREHAEQIGINGTFGIEEMIRYKLETQYGQTNAGARDVLRRISNLVDAVGIENIELSCEDKQFLDSGLRQYVVEYGRNPEFLKDPALQGLRDLGMGVDRTLKLNDTGKDVTALQESLQKLGYGSGDMQIGTFDDTTRSAVEALQQDMGLQDNGLVGREVSDSINQSFRALQHDLHALGYKDGKDRPLKIDSDFGGNSIFALQNLQRESGLEPTGIADAQTLGAIAVRLPNAQTAGLGFDHAAPVVPQGWGPFTPNQAPAVAPVMAPRGFGSSQGVDDNERQRAIDADRAPSNAIEPTNPSTTNPALAIPPLAPASDERERDERETRDRDPQASTKGPFSDPYLDRYYAAVVSGNSDLADKIANEFAQSPEGQRMAQQGDQLLAQQQALERQQAQEQQVAQAPTQQGPVMRL